MEMEIPPIVVYITCSIVFILFAISLYQLCIAPINKTQTKHIFALRITICIALLFEIIVNIIQISSLSTLFVNDATKWSSHISYCLLMFAYTFIIYKLVRSPRLYQQEKWSIISNKIWRICSVLHIIWIIICFIGYIISNRFFFYYLFCIGSHIYIIFASIIVLIISRHIITTITTSIDRINKTAAKQFDDYIYKENEEEEGENEERLSTNDHTKNKISVKTPTTPPNNSANSGNNNNHTLQTSKIDKQLVDPMVALSQLSKAKRDVIIAISFTAVIVTIALIAIYWAATHLSGQHISHSNHHPLFQIDLFVFHYLFSFLIYALSIRNNWYSFKTHHGEYHDESSIYYRLKAIICCQSQTNRSRVHSSSNALDHNPHKKRSKTNQNGKHKHKDNDNGHDPDNNVQNKRPKKPKKPIKLHKTIKTADNEEKTIEIEITDKPRQSIIATGASKQNQMAKLQVAEAVAKQARSPDGDDAFEFDSEDLCITPDVDSANTYGYLSPTGGPTNAPSGKLDFNGHNTLVSYTGFAENHGDSNQLNIPLDKINSEGKQIGRRGVAKPSKMKRPGSEFEQKFNDDVLTIVDYDKTTPKQRPLQIKREITDFSPLILPSTNLTNDISSFNGKMPLTMAATDQSTQLQTATTARAIEDMLETMSLSDAGTTPVSTLVFELGDVLCTNIDKLKGKLDKTIGSMSMIQKQLCFGGEERLTLITNWLKDMHQYNEENVGVGAGGNSVLNIKCFIVSDESSKMVVRLLKDTGLLKYFVSQNPMNPSKYLSHVIGRDHKIAKESSNKKHLILLKLLQFLQRSHDELLYIGGDKEIVQHLQTIKICKTYLVETKGLTQTAIEDIQTKYFIS